MKRVSDCLSYKSLVGTRLAVARELAPAGLRSGPKNATAAQSSGSKLKFPRHKRPVPTGNA